MEELFKKYKDVIPYLFFGICTTLVNIFVYWLCAHYFKIPVMPSTISAWIAAVLFAYVTNRKYVFHSEAVETREIVKEIFTFFMCRLATGVLDWLMMFVFVNCFHFNDLLIKMISNIIVIVLNYIASKLLIFRRI